ncbi:MAG: hypothetical protein KatS3mg027_0793 [Bacteroidia bacterium]|nr:MAG: hypothetical protein KatS3mg027_0793 [Bacteroidia bacterium]
MERTTLRNIKLDTITNKTNLYGLGTVEYLSGEILIIDGKSYKSTVVSDSTMKVEETYDIKAPFYAYANISKWTEQTLPDSIQTIQQLEIYLDKVIKNSPRPFMFKLSGTVEKATTYCEFAERVKCKFTRRSTQGTKELRS